MATYEIDGVESRGDDYLRAFERFSSDELDIITITTDSEFGLIVAPYSDKGYSITEPRSDGSEWVAWELDLTQAQEIVRGFVQRREDWRGKHEWEMMGLPTRMARRRLVWFVLLLIGVIVFVWAVEWNSRHS